MNTTICNICKSNNILKYLVKDGYQLLICNDCKLIFVDNIPNKESINRIYQHFSYNDLDLDEINIRNDAKRSLRIINKYVSVSNLLDIGCGNGYFLDEARKIGWDTKGIDYSDNTVNYAVNTLKLNVIKADLFKYTNKKKFNLITLNQVIEHLVDATKLISKCYSLLDNNGYIYIATPNMDSALSVIFKENYNYLIPPIHLTYFNIKSIKKLLEMNGFRIIYQGTWSYPVDLAAIIKYLFNRDKITMSKQAKKVDRIKRLSFVKIIKIILFDKIFCRIFYKLLNINMMGTNLEIIAQKL